MRGDRRIFVGGDKQGRKANRGKRGVNGEINGRKGTESAYERTPSQGEGEGKTRPQTGLVIEKDGETRKKQKEKKRVGRLLQRDANRG